MDMCQKLKHDIMRAVTSQDKEAYKDMEKSAWQLIVVHFFAKPSVSLPCTMPFVFVWTLTVIPINSSTSIFMFIINH